MTDIESASGEFIAYEHFNAICIARKSASMLHAIAKIIDGKIEGIYGNSGNRFDRLSEQEKIDCYTLLVKINNLTGE